MEKENISTTYKILKKAGMKFSEGEYGRISAWGAFKRAMRLYRNSILLKYCMYSVILAPLNDRKIRPKLWKWMGCRIGKDIYIGYEVWIDIGNAGLIEIEDDVHIASRSILLCHRKDLSDYCQGDDYFKLKYLKEKVILKKGCALGMGSIIMPGVTVGEGAVVAAGSIVTRDVPSWTVVAGNPARVLRNLPHRETTG
jgi:acetyltransferase-like isoleucine patch superfamily enzyme